MKAEFYLWIDGVDFDPKYFDFNLQPDLRGQVLMRKKVIDGEVFPDSYYWRSKSVPLELGNIDLDLFYFMTKYEKSIANLKKERVRIFLEIVFAYSRGEDVNGFFLSAETITLISRMGANLDLDIVRDLSKSD